VILSGSHILEITLEGKTEKMLIQGVARDYRDTTVETPRPAPHRPNQKVKVKVALEFRGTPRAPKKAACSNAPHRYRNRSAGARDSDMLRASVEHLELHQQLHARTFSCRPTPSCCRIPR